MNNPLLALTNVSITRGNKEVLSQINWSIFPQEHWVILGSNGCGKSTLLEIASGYLWPTEGQVYLLEGKLGEVYLPDLRAKIGYVAAWVFAHLTDDIPVEDVIASGTDASIGRMVDMSSSLKQKVNEQLEFFEISYLKGRLFGDLSSGEKLKLILARSLINNPSILILDEPFAHLDISTRYHTYDLLNKLSKRANAPSIILVTHYLEDICPFFTHALLLKQGQIHASGLKNDILRPDLLSQLFNIPLRTTPLA